MTTVDLKLDMKSLYTATSSPQLMEVPPRQYLMIDGIGDPNTSPQFVTAVSSLYPLAYGIRALLKSAHGVAYKVMPLEGLWWVDKIEAFNYNDKSNWLWTMMISLPDAATYEIFENARESAQRKKPMLQLDRVRMETLDEGLSAQVLHTGPFADEPATIARLDEFIAAQGCGYSGKHHEIYLSDFQRVAPQKLRTIIRYPVKRNA